MTETLLRIPYYDAGDETFERIVVAMCVQLLGPAVQPFSTGPDGGRDARFEGTAKEFPNATAPWAGIFVMQAKHTEHPFAKFSDSDFSGDSENSILTKELPRIKRLVEENELDHYLLFSNRRLAGVADAKIRDRIKGQSGARQVDLFGIERMDLLLRQYPAIARVADVRLLNTPLLVNPDDLAVVITALDADREVFAQAIEPVDQLERVSFEKKNTDNGLSADFAKHIRSNYLKDFLTIKRFLAKPGNELIQQRYIEAATELQELILAHRGDYQEFDKVLVRIASLLFERDGDLARQKRLTKLVLYYMYWNCDIGTARDHVTAE
jgi:hypothetical protein